MNAAAQNDLNSSNNSNGSSTNILDFDNVPKGKIENYYFHCKIFLLRFLSSLIALSTWRDAVKRSVTSSQLSMALYFLEQCVAWDKSIMKAVIETYSFLDIYLFYKEFSFYSIELSVLSVW